MSAIRKLIVRHGVATFYVLAFTTSWGGALLAIGRSGGMSGTAPTDDPRFPLAVMAMLAGPCVAGILLTGLVHGRAGLRALLWRLLTWRVGARWYAVALLTAPLVMITTLVALALISPAFLPGLFTSNDKASLLLVGLAVGLGAGMFEELGWMGFAVPELRRRHGFVATGLIAGVLWSAWHFLTNVVWAANLAAGDLSYDIYLSANLLGVLVGYLTAYRVLMVWVYDHTGSLLVAILMHLSFTGSLLILNPLAIAGTALIIYSFALAAVIWIVVAVVVVANRGYVLHPPRGMRVA